MKTMRAAVYLRKSTDEQADSIETQRANAERWCTSRGYAVVAEFEDSGISRTEFSPERRRGWFALQEAAAKQTFEIVIVRDPSRIGGSIGRALVFVEDLLQTGVHVFCYVDGREVTGANALECVTLALQFFGAQTEVEAIRSRTREALLTKARRGLVAGGVVFGYRNVPAPDGSGKLRQVRDDEAAIVREIFDRYAAGEGLRAVTKALNGRGIPSPRAGGRGLGTWSPSAVHAMLRRPLYVGRIEWGLVHKTYRGGRRLRTAEHTREMVTLDAPELRIISAATWAKVAARCAEAPKRRSPGPTPTHLLSGILRCGSCGGPLTVAHSKSGYETIKVYTCQRRRDRGQGSCEGTGRRDARLVDGVVIDWLKAKLLTADFVDDGMAMLRTLLAEQFRSSRGDARKLAIDVRKLDAQIDNLVASLAEAPPGARAVIVAAIDKRREERDHLRAELDALAASPLDDAGSIRNVEKTLRTKVEHLRVLLDGARAKARSFMAKVFGSGLVVTPDRSNGGLVWRLEGTASVGLDVLLQLGNQASPAGFGTLPRLFARAEPVILAA